MKHKQTQIQKQTITLTPSLQNQIKRSQEIISKFKTDQSSEIAASILSNSL